MSLIAFGVGILLGFGPWARSARAAPLTAEEVVSAALARHPDAVAAAQAVEAARAQRRDVATFLENPELSAGVAVVGGLVQGTLLQPLQLGGAGWYARQAGEAGLTGAEGDARRQALVVAAQARAAFSALVTAEARRALADQALGAATQLRVAVAAREAVGESRPLDLRLARLAEAEATALAIEVQRERAAALAELVSLCPAAAEAELPTDPRAVLPSAQGGQARSDLAAAAARVEQAEATLRLERAQALPTVAAGVFVQRDEAHGDPGDLGPQVTFALPLWRRNLAAVGLAQQDLARARAEQAALAARAGVEQVALADVASYAEEALTRLGDFEADAQQALLSIELGWTAGEIDLAQAVLLRQEVLRGWLAGLAARQSWVEARLEALLAAEDPSLLPN